MDHVDSFRETGGNMQVSQHFLPEYPTYIRDMGNIPHTISFRIFVNGFERKEE